MGRLREHSPGACGCTDGGSRGERAGYMDPKTKTWPRSLWAYLSDGTAISIGALMGTSPLTAYAESATGACLPFCHVLVPQSVVVVLVVVT